MKEKRRDSKGRILHTGESQRTDGKYLYKYVDAFGNTKYVYAWRLTPQTRHQRENGKTLTSRTGTADKTGY